MSKIVKRTLDLFELFETERRPLSLSGISRKLGLAASSCHDVLRTMLENGYFHQPGERGEYYPTQRLAFLALEIARNDPFLLRAGHEMRVLRDRYEYSFFLARIEGLDARYLLVVEAQGPWRYHIEPGAKVRSLHATSAGKAILGGLSEEELAETLRGLKIELLTPQTKHSADTLAAEIRESRKRGWYANFEESVQTAATLSARVQWNGAAYILTVAGPASELAQREEIIAGDLMTVARRLEAPR